MAQVIEDTLKLEIEYAREPLMQLLGPEWESVNVYPRAILSDKYVLVGQMKTGRIVSVELHLPDVLSEDKRKLKDVLSKALIQGLEELRVTDRPAALFVKA